VAPPKKTELAWAAGFFDGEGSASLLHGRKGYEHLEYLRLRVGQMHLEPLERFREAVGMSHKNITGPHQNKMFEFGVTGKDAERVADLLTPYLSSIKRRKIEYIRQHGTRTGRMSSGGVEDE
jgi:hypothetical protein